MPITREFLGADRPALQSAADYLLKRYARGDAADLRPAICVVPGSRAGRRLLELLVEKAELQGLLLTPPVIETVGKLPERLYQPKRPFATELTQRLVWAETLRSTPPERLLPVIPHAPEHGDFTRWLELGDLLRRQHVELAGDDLNFRQVADLARTLDGFVEEDRWQALSELQEAYLRTLDGLELWDRQTARLVAIDKHECSTERDLVLVGAVDMNVTLRRMLDQVADRVTALVFAAESQRALFDDHGCLVPNRWSESLLPIRGEQVMVVDGPADQAVAVKQRIAAFAGKYRADEVVIGVPDEQLIPDIQRTLAAAGVTTRWGPGQPLMESRPVHMLRAVLGYLQGSRFADFAALVRHCDIASWLARRGVAPDLLEQLDNYQGDHLPARLSGEWLGKSDLHATVRRAWEECESLLTALRHPPRPLPEWAPPILELLRSIYGEALFDRTAAADRLVLDTCEAISEALQEQGQVPQAIMPRVSAAEALRWLFHDLQNGAAPAPAGHDAVEMLGWLELPLDDAPALIVTSFNEGFVPESINSDLFLPNTLRQRLGMLDNRRRYARDAFAVTLLSSSRESLQWIVGRRNRDGDPLVPSRLLFATDAETAAQRAMQFFRPPPTAHPNPKAAGLDEPPSKLSVPRPKPLPAPISQLRVTSFRDYLACPYRFYLQHILGLDVLDDTARELDGRAFGNLAHDVLSRFGSSKVRDSADPDEIRHVLNHELNACAKQKFGDRPIPAVLVQIEQLRLRMRAFAEAQAAWIASGWRIEMTEGSVATSQTVDFIVDGTPIQLRGRIDRVDVHSETGTRVVWDYKTSDAGDRPEKTHRRGKQWTDLQLPLYRHLARALGIRGDVKLGYITLPKDTSRVQFCVAEWTEQELAEADEIAREAVRRIRREEFWPPARKPPAFSEIYSCICDVE